VTVRPDTMRAMRRSALVLALALLPAPAAAQEGSVTVEVVSTPPGASVEVLGRGEVGRTPLRRLRIARGEHDFVFTRRGYARAVVHAVITEDGQSISATLERPATIQIRAENLAARGARIRV